MGKPADVKEQRVIQSPISSLDITWRCFGNTTAVII